MPPHSHHAMPLETLFGHFVAGDVASFLSGCTDHVILMARGVATEATMVHREELGAWLAAQRALTGGTLRSELRLALSVGDENVVILRTAFCRQGVERSYETINRCTFDSGLLRGWSSCPSDPDEYRRAWVEAIPLGTSAVGPDPDGRPSWVDRSSTPVIPGG